MVYKSNLIGQHHTLLLLLPSLLHFPDTSNEVHTELGEEDEQYMHISTVQPLTCPDMQTLGRINSITSEQLFAYNRHNMNAMKHSALRAALLNITCIAVRLW